MSRLDNFDEILKSYEGREYIKNNARRVLIADEIRTKLSEGYEDHYRTGLLVGELSDVKGRPPLVFDIVIPKQDSGPGSTVVQDWDAAVCEAKSLGALVGFAVYVGKAKPAFVPSTCGVHNRLCKNHGMYDFMLAINHENELIVKLDEYEQTRQFL